MTSTATIETAPILTVTRDGGSYTLEIADDIDGAPTDFRIVATDGDPLVVIAGVLAGAMLTGNGHARVRLVDNDAGEAMTTEPDDLPTWDWLKHDH